MKKGWEYKKLGEVISHLRTGLNPRTHFKLNTPDAENYYITVRELKGFTIEPDEKTDKVNSAAIKRINERSNLKIGDVLFSGTGTIGKTALVSELPENWNIKEGVYAMTPKHSELDSKYFIYYIGSEFFLRLVNDKAAGTGVRSIPMKELVKIPIFIPPLSEQQSIVDYLDSAFAKIDSMKANAEKALNEAKALFQASLKEMLEPKEGWEEKKFGKICNFVRGPFGGSLKKECFKDSGYPVYEQQNAIYNKFTFRYFIDEEKFKSLIRFKVNAGDLIMSCSGTIGKVAIIPERAKDGIINQALLKLTPNKDVDAHFLKYLMESNYFKEIINANIEGVAIKNIASVAVLKEIKLYIPKVNEQQNIVLEIDSLKSKVDRLQANYDKISQECDALKQAILRQVFE